MRLFLTGATGFIGSRVRRLAESRGHQVMCLNSPHRMSSLPLEALAAFRPDACVHCAWIATPGIYQHSPLNTDHVAWSLALVRELLRIGTQRLVVAGSCAEYSPSLERIPEEHPLVADGTPYAMAKVRLHRELRELQRSREFSLAWPRIFFPYGAGEHPERLFSLVASACRQGCFDQTMLRKPRAVRDYIHGDDVASALVLLAERGANGPYNVGTGRGVAIGAAAAKLAQMLKSRPLADAASPDGEIEDMVVSDPGRLMAYGWRPVHTVDTGFADYLDQSRGGLSST